MKVETLLERLGSPADVLRSHGIQVRGRMALCPFHDDSTPSLSLFNGRDGRARWKCHACDRGGDSVDLETAFTGRSVRELLH